MSNNVNIIEFEDKDNTSKRITVEFSQNVTRIDELNLFNVEITENGDRERVNLNEKSNRMKTAAYSSGKHDFLFDFGQTLFNDGAEFSINVVINKSKKSEKYTFILNGDKWDVKEDNDNEHTNIR